MNWLPKFLSLMGMVSILLTAVPAQQVPPADQAVSVDDQVIQQVLEPLRTGVQTHNVQLALSVFDRKELKNYPNLDGELRAFFEQFDEIRFRYQLLQVTADKDRGSATAEMEIDALPYDVTQIPVRRSARMRLQLKLEPKGWRIVGFTPADFFSVQYNPGENGQRK